MAESTSHLHIAWLGIAVAALLLVMLAMLTGCASVVVKKIPTGSTMDGIHFYRPAPYLMVSSDASKELQFKIVWMPDKSEEYIIQAKPGLGSVSFNPTLENGWNLTGLNATVDTKTAEILTALPGLISGAAGMRAAPVEGKKFNIEPGMYPLRFEGGKLIGVEWDKAVFRISEQPNPK